MDIPTTRIKPMTWFTRPHPRKLLSIIAMNTTVLKNHMSTWIEGETVIAYPKKRILYKNGSMLTM